MLVERSGIPRRRRRRRRVRPQHAARRLRPGAATAIDAVLVLLLGGAVLLVHDVGYLLGHPYWLDEAWVADSIRAPIRSLPRLTSSSPLGWAFLLRLVPDAGQGQSARLVPLLFCALAAMAGYVLGKELRLDRHLTGLLIGVAVLLSPAMLIRADLKQYTAEVFASITVLALTARLENDWSRSRLLALGGFVAASLLIAPTDLFVGASAFGGVLVEAAIRRSPRRLAEAAVVGTATGIVAGALYLTLVARNVVPALEHYWDGYYLSGGLSGVARELLLRSHQLAPLAGSGHLWVVVLLALAGVMALAVAGRWALALTVPITVAANVVAAMAKAYPFGDPRTSTFWLVPVTVLMAVADAYLAHWTGRRAGFSAARWAARTARGAGESRAGTWGRRATTAAVAALALWIWVPSTHPYMRAHTISDEDVRDQVVYLQAHYRPGDVVVVDELASFGFAFYDARVRPTYVHSATLATGFFPTYPHDHWIVQLPARTADDVHRALSTATARICAEGPEPGRIWIVRSHQSPAEVEAWSRSLPPAQSHVVGKGPEKLLEYEPRS